MLWVRVGVFAAGAFVVLATVASAIRIVVLPRGVVSRLARRVFLMLRFLFELRVGRSASYERRDRIMALYGPSTLLVLLTTWMSAVLSGYTAMFWGLGGRSVTDAFILSGSSLLTLGFASPPTATYSVFVFTEAAIGLFLVALLITYLPSLYAAFSRREAVVAMLEVRASAGTGAPPTAPDMLLRFARIHGLDRLHEMWGQWESWFVHLEETHTSFPALAFFRSPQPDHSWVNAAGAILDAAAIRSSSLEGRDADAELCIRAGYLALRRIASFFDIEYDSNPLPGDPISIKREEFDGVYDRLAEQKLPLRKDRDKCWESFAGWRVNYDRVLLALAHLTMAPISPWSSDREPLPVIRR